jgi:hypothetical protein
LNSLLKSFLKDGRWKIFLIAILSLAIANLFMYNPSPEVTFVVDFLTFVLLFGLNALVGGMLGRALASVSEKYVKNCKPIVGLLRLGLWLPVLVMWAVPLESLLGVLSVAMAAGYYHLSLRNLLFLDLRQAKSVATAETILHALLITLLIQVLQSEFGWFMAYDSHGLLMATSALTLILVTLYLLRTRMSYDFAVTADVHTRIVEGVITDDSRLSPSTRLIIASVLLLSWQGLSFLGLDAWISSPWSVAKMMMSDLSAHYALWEDIAVSVAEICLGLLISVMGVIYLWEFLSSGSGIQHSASKFLYFTYIAPIVFVPWLVRGGILRGFWLVTASVALLSFFPALRVSSRLTSRPRKIKLLLGSLEALPYAFVGMLFGEAMSSFRGLGFELTPVQYNSRGGSAEAMSLFLIVAFLMAFMSRLLMWSARTETNSSGTLLTSRNNSEKEMTCSVISGIVNRLYEDKRD